MKNLILSVTSFDFINSIPNYGDAIGHIAALIVSGVDRDIAIEMVGLCQSSKTSKKASDELVSFIETSPKLGDVSLFEGLSIDNLPIFKSLRLLSDEELAALRDPLNYLHFGRKPQNVVNHIIQCEIVARNYPADFADCLKDANRTLSAFTGRDKKASKW